MRTTAFNAAAAFRAASSLETTRRALLDAAKELETAPDDAARRAAQALRDAEAQVVNARRALQATALAKSPLQLLATAPTRGAW